MLSLDPTNAGPLAELVSRPQTRIRHAKLVGFVMTFSSSRLAAHELLKLVSLAKRCQVGVTQCVLTVLGILEKTCV